MQDKKIYELTKLDMDNHPIWFFPMDESVDDETSIRPCLNPTDENLQMVIAAEFIASNGNTYSGYVYHDLSTNSIEYVKPVIFIGKNIVTFWNGIHKPSWIDYPSEVQEIKHSMPIKFQSKKIPGLSVIEGELEGLYYFNESYQISYI